MFDPVLILLALLAGVAFRKAGFPPLLGYLIAGFVMHSLGGQPGSFIDGISDVGITLLLFTIGLKLNLRDLAAVQVWGVGTLHMLLSVPLLAVSLVAALWLLPALPALDSPALWTLAFALSFSSTVFAVKIFEERGESAAFHAKIAIGILIVQDIAAVVFLALSTGEIPNWTALLLLLLIPIRPLIMWLFRLCGHGELLTLFGITLALGGYALFEFFQIKGDVGALLLGVLLGGSGKTNELAKALLNLKDLFLVGFFVGIGLNGLPSMDMIWLSLILGGVLFIKPLLFYGLFVATHLRSRTALLASLALFNYSEFGLIVAALAASTGLLGSEWMVMLALALSVSYFIAVPFNARSLEIYKRLHHHLFERKTRLASEQGVNFSDATIVVLGMGRVGSGAYRYLRDIYGDKLIGVEEIAEKVPQLQDRGFNVVHGDANDLDFWEQVDLPKVELIMVSLTNHSENINVCNLLDEVGYQGSKAVIARFPDQLQELKDRGCIAFNLYAEAGYGFAEHVCKELSVGKENAPG